MILRPCKGGDSCVLLFVMIKECKGKTVKVSDSQASQACKGKPDAKVLTAKPARREILVIAWGLPNLVL